MSLVIDASALLELLARPDLAQFLHTNSEVSAPSLVQWEVGHAIHKSRATVPDPRKRRLAVRILLEPLRLVDQRDRSDAIADLVETHSLSYYDAAYLQLALDEGSTLLTEDKALLLAAQRTLGEERAWSIEDASAEVDLSERA